VIPELRGYQADAIAKLRELAALGKRRLLIISPTGSGKTVTFSAVIRSSLSRGRRAIVIAHRKELIDQTVKKLEDFGVRAGVIMGQDARRDSRLAVQVCSIQTLAKRLDRLPPADLVVVDEAHHALSNSYREVLARYERALVLGATATPWRSDKLGLADLFDDAVVAATPRDLIASGALVGYEPFAYDAPDLHNVGVVAGEYNQRQLGLACNTDVLVADIVREYAQHAAGRPALVFPVGIESSRRIVERFREEGFAAEHLDCNTPKVERERIIDGLRTRRVTIVSSVGVLTEGFDAPAAEVCILARPTLSLSLYMQMVGRVLRPCAGKGGALIHDHAGNLLRHGFPDDDRDYSLEATEQRVLERHCCPFCRVVYSQRRADGTCPKCGQLIALAE
jgi:DNA repair protein RadD